MTKPPEWMRGNVGDVVAIEPRRVGTDARTGEIVEVLGGPEHEHYRVRWEDGHESIFYPSSGAVIRPPRASRPRASRPRDKE